MSMRRACLVLVLCAGAIPAMAQNALDRPLQQDLRANGAAGYTRPDFAQEVRLRNALVTGNVGGGKSLQIARPYAGIDDFYGTLGTDSLFAFRRDSFGYSNTNTFRNSDALTFQTIYALGNNQPKANSLLPRFGDTRVPPSSGTQVLSDQPNPAFTNVRPSAPTDTLPPGSLRSTSEFVSTRGLNPTLIGFQQGEQGLERVTASSLLGVRTDLAKGASEQFSEGAGLAPANSAAPEAIDTSAQAKPDDSYRTAYDQLRERLNATVIDTSVNAPIKPAATPSEAVKGTTPTKPGTPGTDANKPKDFGPGTTNPARSTPAGGGGAGGPASTPGSGADPAQPSFTPTPLEPLTPGGFGDASLTPEEQAAWDRLPPWEKRVQQLRRVLESPPARTRVAPGEEIVPTPQEQMLGLDTPEKIMAARRGVDPETIDILRSATPQFSEYLSGKPRPGDLYSEQLYEGQKFLGEGKYFDAEERFASAAAMRPGDVTALVGRVNAELGAGLYLSAAVNLRGMYARHPEVIGVRFEGDAVPRIDRMKRIMVDLREQIARAKAASIPARPEVSLLLAYVGYQLENTDAIRDGLAELEAAQRSGDGGQADPLRNVLEAVWLHRDLRAIPQGVAPQSPSGPGVPAPGK